MTEAADGRSRRHVLRAAVGGAAAALAGALGRPATALGADGDKVVLGRNNHATSPTKVRNPDDTGLWGDSRHGTGLVGTSALGHGVMGTTVNQAAVGVLGQNLHGTAILGTTTDGTALSGETIEGTGVFALSKSGTGLLAVSGTAYAIQTVGRLDFATSGVASVPAGSSSVTISQELGTASFVLLTPRANLAGRDLWFRTNPAANTFTIHMSTPRQADTEVSWLLLG